MTYRVVRYFQHDKPDRGRRRTIRAGLSLAEAQEWCNNPETSSASCRSYGKRQITRKEGPWFDGYESEQ